MVPPMSDAWREEAECLGSPRLMDPRRVDDLKECCSVCPVRPECAQEALDFFDDQQYLFDRENRRREALNAAGVAHGLPRQTAPALYGVWGGVECFMPGTRNPVFAWTDHMQVVLGRLRRAATEVE